MSDHFPDAETMRKQADAVSSELRSVRIHSIRVLIEAETKKGRFCVTVSNLHTEDADFLRSKGYAVRSLDTQREPSKSSSISWGRAT